MEKEKKPRSWSNKYWTENDVIDIINEVIEPEGIDVSSIQYHDDLNPAIWDSEDKLNEEVRKTLLMNAKKFIEFSDMENIKFKDVILTGSMANYNYNDISDLDIHIILDFDQISEDKDFVGKYFRLNKNLWGSKLPIQVKGHDVEMYFQDASEPHHSSGTYSLMHDEWINKPTKKIVNIDTGNIQLKAADFMNVIDELETISDSDVFFNKYNLIKDRIKKMRQSGLDNIGEFSSENLAFKILRNSGYLQKLVELKKDRLTKELSLDENK
jgi:hypothetical protein